MEAKTINELEFEPLNDYFSCGNEVQLCSADYKNVNILWRTVFWWNVFKEPSDTFSLGLCLPIDTVVENGRMEHIYEDEGFGSPHFNTLEHAIEFINKYQDEQISIQSNTKQL